MYYLFYIINITYMAISQSFGYFIVSIKFLSGYHLNWIIPVKDTLQDFTVTVSKYIYLLQT